MDLHKIRFVYENGLPPFVTNSNEEPFACLVALRVNSFRTAFVPQLTEFRAVLRDKRSGARLELSGGPEPNLLGKAKAFIAEKPGYTELVRLQDKTAFDRLEKGTHFVCLQGSILEREGVELVIERKDTTAPALPEDDDDTENRISSTAQYVAMTMLGQMDIL